MSAGVCGDEKIKNRFYSGQSESVTWKGGLGLRSKGSLEDMQGGEHRKQEDPQQM